MAEFHQEGLETLTTEQLEELLRLEMQTQDPAPALRILKILSMRQPENQDQTAQAWETFRRFYQPGAKEGSLYEPPEEPPRPAGKKRRRLSRFLPTAALVALAGGVLIVQAGGTNPLGTFARWTSEQFTFGSTILAAHPQEPEEAAPQETESSPEEEKGVSALEYETLAEAAAAFGLEGPYVPSWLPEEYALENVQIRNLEGMALLSAYYAGEGDHCLIVHYDRRRSGSEGTSIHEKDDTPVEIYERDGVSYYFLSNLDFQSVTWMPEETLECSIGGTVSQETLRKIVDSMYERQEGVK
ncbi:DUF4367 domain-containing protein [Dysosmobacter sp.]